MKHSQDVKNLYTLYNGVVSNLVKDKCLFIISVKLFISKVTNTGKLDVSEINNTVGKLLEDAIHEDELLNLGELTRGNSLELLSDSILSKLRAMKDKNVAAEVLSRAIKTTIGDIGKINLTLQEKFSTKFNKIVDMYNERMDIADIEKIIEEMVKLKKEIEEEIANGNEYDLSPEEKAFFDALGADPEIKELMQDKVLVQIAKDLVELINENLTLDAFKREDARARIRSNIRRLLIQYNYPPVKREGAVDKVIKQAELKSNNEFFMAFSFVNDYISSGYFDKELMKISLQHYNKVNYEVYNENDPYTIINCYWEKESDELKNALEGLKQNLIDKKYNVQLYPKILSKLSCLLSIEFEKDLIEDIINTMKEMIKDSDINYIDFHAFIDDQKVLDIYNLKVEEFNLIIKENKIDKYKTKIELLLEQENWAEELNDYVYENNKNGVFIDEKGFLAKLDIDMIVSNLKKSDNKNIFCFKYAIERVYNFSNLKEYFSEDLDNLNKLIDELNKFKDSDDIMKSFALNHLYNTLVRKQEIICK